MPSRRRRITAVVTAALLSATALALSSPATARPDATGQEVDVSAKGKPYVRATIKPAAEVVRGTPTRLRVETSTWRVPVKLQLASEKKWRTVASKRTSRASATTFALPTTTVGTFTYRVRARFPGVRKVLHSPRVTLRVGGPLTGPYVLHGRDLVELRGLHRRVTYVPGNIVAAADTGRVIYETYGSDENTLHVAKGGSTNRRLLRADCVGWAALSRDGTHAVYGEGRVDGIRCFPPQTLTLLDLETGDELHLPVPTEAQRFAALDDPFFSADGRYLFLGGDFTMAVYETATGQALRLPRLWEGDDAEPWALDLLEPTNLTTTAGAFIVRARHDIAVSPDCPSGLYAVLPNSQRAPTCWNGRLFTHLEAKTLTASPDGSRVAWTSLRDGTLHYVTAPAVDLTDSTDHGSVGYPQRDYPHLHWLGTGYLQSRAATTGPYSTGESTIELATGDVFHGAPHGFYYSR